jgi:hypothetical protein
MRAASDFGVSEMEQDIEAIHWMETATNVHFQKQSSHWSAIDNPA